MLLIYPPVARATEPPLGIARLAGFLRERGRASRCLDLSIEAFDYLLSLPPPSAPLPSALALAFRRRERNREALCTPGVSLDRHTRAVVELSRVLASVSEPFGAAVGLADYSETARSPVSRGDLIAAAREPESSVFFPLFQSRLSEVLGRPGPPKSGAVTAEVGAIAEVGVSLCFLSQALPAFALLGYLRREYPDLRIALGGGLITSWIAQGSLSADDGFDGLVDALLPGRGEESLPAWLGLGERAPGPAALRDRQGRPLRAPIGERSARPRFEDFAANRYLSPGAVIPYNLSWGCPWLRCTFCPEVAEGSVYRGVRADTAVAELREIVRLHKPAMLHLTDNEIAPLYLRSLAEHPPGAPWYGFARFSPCLLDLSFCHALAQSGCTLLQLGLESGSQRVLDALGKGTRVEDNERILGNLKAAGIAAYLYVLFGTPAETEADARLTRDFVARHASGIGFLNLAIFNLPVASEEARQMETRAFYGGSLSLYREFSHPSNWNRDAVRAFIRTEVEADPRIRPIILGNPPVFTSNHAPFFCR